MDIKNELFLRFIKFLIKCPQAMVLISMQIACFRLGYASIGWILLKPIIEKILRTVSSRFKDNIWVTDLSDRQLIRKFNKIFRFLLCAIDIFSKYVWVKR